MTDTHTARRVHASRPVSGRGSLPGRLLRAIWYDVRLPVLGVQTMADAALGENRTEARRQEQVEPAVGDVKAGRPGAGVLFGFGVITTGLGVVGWFLVGLLGMAVVRGAFYGFVEDGPYGAGTWGGPTKAGAWAVHAGVSVPMVVGLVLALWGIQGLHRALVRWLYGIGARWVLPATICVCAAGVLLSWSWIQQL